MHSLHTLMITLLLDDQDPDFFCGRIRLIATGEEVAFSGVEELVDRVQTIVQARRACKRLSARPTDF
jgi:hypothetical protein